MLQVVSAHARTRRIHLTRRGEAVAWTALWVAIAALVVLPYMHSYRHLSPFDEMVHLDYLVKVQDGHLVRGGKLVGDTAMREQACRGHDLAEFTAPPCDKKEMRPAPFPFGGYNTAYPDPPAYYVFTAAGATLLQALPGIHDIVTAARAVGVIWLGAGLALTFLLALRLGANRWSAAGTTLVVASAPTVAHAMATITSDAPSLVVGAALCLVALAVVRGQAPWWWLPGGRRRDGGQGHRADGRRPGGGLPAAVPRPPVTGPDHHARSGRRSASGPRSRSAAQPGPSTTSTTLRRCPVAPCGWPPPVVLPGRCGAGLLDARQRPHRPAGSGRHHHARVFTSTPSVTTS